MATPDAARVPLASGAFRVVATAVAVFVLVAVAIATKLYGDASAALTREVVASLETEAAIITHRVDTAGPVSLAQDIEQRSRGDRAGLYFLADAEGRKLAGNLTRVPPELAGKPQGGVFTYEAGSPDRGTRQAVALTVRLADGRTLVIGRDVDEQRRTLAAMRMTGFAGFALLALLGLAGGYAASRYVLARVEAVNATAHSIMAGDLGRRIALAGSGDEIDDLARNINLMLDRIEQLMAGLREVSDNIAHDLKTPLNRLRNRAEAALREASGADALRVGLERTIEEADELIKVFNALLLIARLEAGALEGSTEAVEVGALVGDVVELYEPVAEEAGLTLTLQRCDPVEIEANRQLVGQAVANLVDNAIKYSVLPAKGGGGRPADRVVIAVTAMPGAVEISIADNGPGIGAEDRSRVLQRFVRLERSRSRPGTGLGLSLVAAVARLHDGEVRLEDNAPGLRVVLRLPSRKPQARKQITSEAAGVERDSAQRRAALH